jgi:hypothetical protein
LNLDELHRSVLAEIDSYRYDPPEGLGPPFAKEKVTRLLEEMRAALVEPEWRVVAIRDTPDGMQLDPPENRRCVLVADDRHGYELYYDTTQDEFFLVADGSVTVWGDAVGCFMAR